MTANEAKNAHLVVKEAGDNIPEVRGTVVSEDGSGSVSDDGSCSSSNSGSSEDSSTSESLPPDASMNADQIRKNARELLQASPDHGTGKKSGRNIAITPPTTSTASNPSTDNVYASYHDAPSVRMSSEPQFSNSFDDANGATPPWANSGPNNDGINDEGLTVADVASMALTCVAHCLTEGYRAASSYYGADHQQTQYPSVSGSNYQQLPGYRNEAYGNISSSNCNGSSDDRYENKGYYSDSYQTEAGDNSNRHREVMDRGFSRDATQLLGQVQETEQPTTQQVIEQKEEWTTVHVPPTYQGGRVAR